MDKKTPIPWYHTVADMAFANYNGNFLSGIEQLGKKDLSALENPARNKSSKQGRFPPTLDSIIEKPWQEGSTQNIENAEALKRKHTLTGKWQKNFKRRKITFKIEAPLNVKNQDILDRFQSQSTIKDLTSHCGIFFARSMGLNDELRNIVSPYTKQSLKPYIYRDYKTEPLRLKFLREIVSYPHRNNPDWKPSSYPIDYSYIRVQHVPAINALCQKFFWPGIDSSDCLKFPDFSCVALYRKIVIGFALMVPDVNVNEAYITYIFSHPDWRKCGIATFMLYHLMQICIQATYIPKDIILHVPAKSPAVPLFQKFGFKHEEFILDFYDKYLPEKSRKCRHALFLRQIN